MPSRLSGQVAIVTGSGNGIGRAYAKALAGQGASLVINDLGCDMTGRGASHEPADKVVEEIVEAGGKAVANYEDVATWEGAGRIVQTAVKAFGRLDTIVCNAGADRRAWVLDLTPEDWERTLRIHLFGNINCALQAAKVMKEQGQGGAIINITSGSYYQGTLRLAPYVVSKGGIYSLMRSLSQELRQYNISANCISPGALTRATRAWVQSLADVEKLPAEVVQARRDNFQEPEHMGPLAVFLASPEGRKITGQVFGLTRDQATVLGLPTTGKVTYAKMEKFDLENIAAVMPKLVPMKS